MTLRIIGAVSVFYLVSVVLTVALLLLSVEVTEDD